MPASPPQSLAATSGAREGEPTRTLDSFSERRSDGFAAKYIVADLYGPGWLTNDVMQRLADDSDIKHAAYVVTSVNAWTFVAHAVFRVLEEATLTPRGEKAYSTQ